MCCIITHYNWLIWIDRIFHGIILAAGRASLNLGELKWRLLFRKDQPRFQTPSNALLVNMAIGIIALLTGKHQRSSPFLFWRFNLYIVSMISLLRLRKKEPQLERPFKVPMYPLFPIIALIIAVFNCCNDNL
jgi:ethanolamine permease